MGISRLRRSNFATAASQSGLWSNHAIDTNCDRSTGSFSMYHEKASLSRMNTSTRSPTVATPLTVICGVEESQNLGEQGHAGVGSQGWIVERKFGQLGE